MKIDREKHEITLGENETIGQVCDAIRYETQIGGSIRDWVIRVEPIEKIVYVPIQQAPCCPVPYPTYPIGPIWINPSVNPWGVTYIGL